MQDKTVGVSFDSVSQCFILHTENHPTLFILNSSCFLPVLFQGRSDSPLSVPLGRSTRLWTLATLHTVANRHAPQRYAMLYYTILCYSTLSKSNLPTWLPTAKIRRDPKRTSTNETRRLISNSRAFPHSTHPRRRWIGEGPPCYSFILILIRTRDIRHSTLGARGPRLGPAGNRLPHLGMVFLVLDRPRVRTHVGFGSGVFLG